MWQLANPYNVQANLYNVQGPVCADWIMAERNDMYPMPWGADGMEPPTDTPGASPPNMSTHMNTHPAPAHMTQPQSPMHNMFPQMSVTSPNSMRQMTVHHPPTSSSVSSRATDTPVNTPSSTSSSIAHMTQPPSPMHNNNIFPPMTSPSSMPQMTVHHPPVSTSVTSSASNSDTPANTSLGAPHNTPLVVPQPVKTMKPTTKTYHCRMCNQELPNKSAMQKHAKEVHMLDQKAHKCEKCFKSFPTSQQLQQHMLVHTNLRRYKCAHCDKAFKQLSHVQQHQRIHTGEKPYKCTVEGCERAFAQLSNLQHHMRHHEGHSQRTMMDRKPWQCNICDRRFATDASLNNHITKFHCDPEKASQYHPCPGCDKEFRTKLDLQNHLKDIHLAGSPEDVKQLSDTTLIKTDRSSSVTSTCTVTNNNADLYEVRMRERIAAMRPMLESLFSSGAMAAQRHMIEQQLGMFSRSVSLPNIGPTSPTTHTLTSPTQRSPRESMFDQAQVKSQLPPPVSGVPGDHHIGSPVRSYGEMCDPLRSGTPAASVYDQHMRNDVMNTGMFSPRDRENSSTPLMNQPHRGQVVPPRNQVPGLFDHDRTCTPAGPLFEQRDRSGTPASTGIFDQRDRGSAPPTSLFYHRDRALSKPYPDASVGVPHVQTNHPCFPGSPSFMGSLQQRPHDYIDLTRDHMHSPAPQLARSQNREMPASTSYIDTTQTRLQRQPKEGSTSSGSSNSGSVPSTLQSCSSNYPPSSPAHHEVVPPDFRRVLPNSQPSHSGSLFSNLFGNRQ